MSELSDKNKPFVKNLGQEKVLIFPASLQKIIPDLTIKGNLFALQGRLNLNNLVEKNYQDVFLRLLQKKLTDRDLEGLKRIVLAMKQWLSPYLPGRGQDEFFVYYGQQKPPYYPSQQFMQNPSELRLIYNISAKDYLTLADFITVLPSTTPINLNFAAKPVLMSLGNGLNENQVMEIINARAKEGFINKNDLPPLLGKLNLDASLVTLENEYFLSIAEVRSQDRSLFLYSTFKRQTNKNGDISVILIAESLNTL
jgi:general secretion pathway protein K